MVASLPAEKKPADFERNIGNQVDVKLYRKKGNKKQFTGILKSHNEDGYIVKIDGEDTMFTHQETANICRHIDF